MMIDNIEKIYKINLKVKKGERVLVITDGLTDEIEKIAKEFFKVADALGLKADIITYKPLSSHGEEPPIDVWKRAGFNINDKLFKRLKAKEEIELEASNPPDVLLSITHFSTSHTIFRKILTKIGARYVSMPLFETSMLLGPMDVDYKKMNMLGKKIKDVLEDKEKIRVLSESGTDLSFMIKGRKIIIDGGILTKKGAFGNLPAGEVFVAPIEGSANGILVIEVMEKRSLKEPLIAEIKDGMVIALKGEMEGKKRLEGIFSKYNLARNIAEFGIGINDKARNPENILEAEKILGTCHIAFGDNSAFGGNTSVPFHEDYVIFSGTIDVEGRIMLDKGRIVL